MNHADKQPKYIITYICGACGNDFICTENDLPNCFVCEKPSNCKEIKREEITAELIGQRLRESAATMVQALKELYQQHPEEINETELLQALEKSARLRDEINNLELKEPPAGQSSPD